MFSTGSIIFLEICSLTSTSSLELQLGPTIIHRIFGTNSSSHEKERTTGKV